MPVFYNVLGSQNIAGSLQQDQFYAFTSDTNLNNVRADSTLPLLSWTTGIRTSATDFLTLSRANVQISSDFYSGSEKVDTIFGSNLNDAILYNNGVVSGIFGSFSSIEQIELGAGDDIVDLTAHGAGGLDYGKNITIRAGAGDDIIIGGAGLDTIYGEDGNDLIFGYRGADMLYGGTGDDRLYGDDLGFNGIAGADFLYGEAGDDFLDGGARGDFLNGGEGNDTLIGGAGDDSIFGDIGVDTAVFSGNQSDYLIVWDGIDTHRITDLRPGSPDGTDVLMGVEFFQFADTTVAASVRNTAPVITSDGGDVFATITLEENNSIVTTVTSTDVDSNQTVSFSISGGADAALFTIDPVTGVLSFVNAPDFEKPADAGQNNVYDIRVRATDSLGAFDEQFVSITVTNIADGSPPRIVSNGGQSTTSVSRSENSPGIALVVAVDPDGTTPTYSIIGGADAALFSIDPQSGVLRFINAPDFENPLDVGADNNYEVTVQASDGVYVDQQQFFVSVVNINDNNPTIISGGGGAIASVSSAENQRTVFTVVAQDADASAVTYSIVGGADAALFTINAQTGALEFITAPDFELPTDADFNGIYDVTVRASDGTLFDDQAISVTVTDLAENPPTIRSNGGGATAAINIAENSSFVTAVNAIDPEGTIPTYSIVGGADAALFFINPQTGVLNFIKSPDFEMPLDADFDGIYEVIVRASDGIQFDDQALSVTVRDINEIGVVVTGTSGNNTISPISQYMTTAFDDAIYALAGNDIIDGGAGADRMEGGTGNDTYYVDQFSDDGNSSNDDLVIELAGAGTDLVNSKVSYILTANVENLTLIGPGPINGTGNDLNNVIRGTDTVNVLIGGAGNDSLFGNGGNDSLFGGIGNDSLDGGLGADLLEGGDGNDTYYIDAFSIDGVSSNDDIVVEFAGAGIDTVISTLTYILPDNVENLTVLQGNGTGNNLANVIKGGTGDNFVYGLGGNDTINGNEGEDRLYGGDGNDVISGGSEIDNLFGEAGNDTLLGGADGDYLYGDIGDDILSGQSGSDVIVGGLGRDTLTGGLDIDYFKFGMADTSVSASTIDVITDFTTGVDRIELEYLNRNGVGIGYSEAAITTNSFNDAFASAQAMLSGGKSVAFVAGSTDGWLFWDNNGDGIIDQSILLKGVGSLGGFDLTDIM